MPKRSRSSKKDPQVRIAHILDSIDAIEGYLAGMTLETFTRDAKTQDAVTRRFVMPFRLREFRQATFEISKDPRSWFSGAQERHRT